MREKLTNDDVDVVDFEGKMQKVDGKCYQNTGEKLVTIKGEDCAVRDKMIIQHIFEEDPILFEATMMIYDSIHTVFQIYIPLLLKVLDLLKLLPMFPIFFVFEIN